MFLCTVSVRPDPLPTDTSSLQFLLRSIAYCAQTSESTPRCTKIVEHSEYAVKHFQVIRDDLQNAIRKRDFSDVFNAGYLTDFDTWLKEYEPYGRSARMLSRKSWQSAWELPYQTNAHELLLFDLNRIYRSPEFVNIASIIQCSGSGKSRMVHEAARSVFSLPINLLREEKPHGLHYPVADVNLREFLLDRFISSTDRLQVHFYSALASIFHEVRKEVDTLHSSNFQSKEDLARCWNARHTRNLFQEIPNRANAFRSHKVQVSRDHATRQAQTLLESLACVCQTSEEESEDGILILLSFDNSHELSDRYVSVNDEGWKTYYDVLLSCLDCIAELPLFTLFISTAEPLTSVPRSFVAGSIRKKLHAPFINLPFDCHPRLPLDKMSYSFTDIHNIDVAAMFGRPLFWAMLESSKSHYEPYRAQEIVDLASRQLFGVAPLSGFEASNGHLALLDVRLSLDYTSSEQALAMQKTLCNEHMRYVYSTSESRPRFRSGYPSEPVLAEAAAQKQFFLRYNPEEHLKLLFSEGVLKSKRKGACTARLLLTKAYDSAVIRDHGEPDNDAGLFFSQGCRLTSFITELFGEYPACDILNNGPDNVGQSSGQTFRDAFAKSKLRFTHFHHFRADDGCGTTASFMFAAFLRSAAVIVTDAHGGVDIMIPVFLDEGRDLCADAMSAICLRVRQRTCAAMVSPAIGYVVEAEQVDLFPRNANGEASDERPYVSIVMELGAGGAGKTPSVTSCVPESRLTKANFHPRYGIYAFGCSSKTFAVIEEAHDHIYADIFSDNIHSEDLLTSLRLSKPTWSTPEDCIRLSEHFMEDSSTEYGDDVNKQITKVVSKVVEVDSICEVGDS